LPVNTEKPAEKAGFFTDKHNMSSILLENQWSDEGATGSSEPLCRTRIRRSLRHLLFAFPLFLCLNQSPSAFVLVDAGKPICAIIIRNDAPDIERYAAGEISGYIEKISGARIPVNETDSKNIPFGGSQILLGQGTWLTQPRFKKSADDLEAMGKHAFVIHSYRSGRSETLVISGGSPRSTVYAAFELLERIGMRWYAPDVERIPRMKTVDLGYIGLTDFPCFEYRDATLVGGKEASQWKARLRLNTGMGFLEEEHGCEPAYVPDEVGIGELFPPDLFSSHPEYYPMIDGKRTNIGNLFCFSQKQATQAVGDSINSRLSRARGITHLSLLFDFPGMVCHCPECTRILKQEGGESGLALRWLNSISARISPKHGDVTLEMTSPWITPVLPKSARPRKNIAIVLSGENLRPVNSGGQSDKESAAFMTALKSWSSVSEKIHVELFCPPLERAPFSFPDLEQMCRNTVTFRDRYIEGLFVKSPAGKGIFVPDSEMRMWVLSRMMWNSDLNSEDLVRDWMRGVYGNAAGPMIEYWKQVQKAVSTGRGDSNSPQGLSEYLDDRFLNAAELIIQKAYALSLTDSISRRYVRKARLSLWYLRLLQVQDSIAKGKKLDDAERVSCLERVDRLEKEFWEFGYDRISETRDMNQFAQEIHTALGK
jgi:hypothetical protein